MTPERAKKLFPIVQAFAEGRVIQAKYDDDGAWIDTDSPSFYDCVEYRIKPETKTGWVNIYALGVAYGYSSKKEAEDQADPKRIACIQIIYTEGEGL